MEEKQQEGREKEKLEEEHSLGLGLEKGERSEAFCWAEGGTEGGREGGREEWTDAEWDIPLCAGAHGDRGRARAPACQKGCSLVQSKVKNAPCIMVKSLGGELN